jgi:Zn-dependent peptidase ImmA (M78 family)
MSRLDDLAPEIDADEGVWHQQRAFKLARELARACVKRHNAKGVPLDIVALVEAEGLRLVQVEEDTNTAGVLYPKSREIIVNGKGRHLVRQRFTIAHELGHWVLAHHKRGPLVTDLEGFDGRYGNEILSHSGKDSREQEANVFAAELLVPKLWLQEHAGHRTPDALAQLFMVSRETMYYQMMEYRMI